MVEWRLEGNPSSSSVYTHTHRRLKQKSFVILRDIDDDDVEFTVKKTWQQPKQQDSPFNANCVLLLLHISASH